MAEDVNITGSTVVLGRRTVEVNYCKKNLAVYNAF